MTLGSDLVNHTMACSRYDITLCCAIRVNSVVCYKHQTDNFSLHSTHVQYRWPLIISSTWRPANCTTTSGVSDGFMVSVCIQFSFQIFSLGFG